MATIVTSQITIPPGLTMVAYRTVSYETAEQRKRQEGAVEARSEFEHFEIEIIILVMMMIIRESKLYHHYSGLYRPVRFSGIIHLKLPAVQIEIPWETRPGWSLCGLAFSLSLPGLYMYNILI
jgi:hypothetical protein